ncbi:ATPase [Christiangramia sp. LLG6405-1]|uniref:ATPase n=1 Tax=Christiangramia sp. LLG6405-1 TaxID=3160832 RepID=UPI0038694CE4
MNNPCKIQEGGMEYILGSYDGKKITYEFPKMLEYLDAKGKMVYGKDFKIYKKDHPLLHKLCNYYIRDHINCQRYKLDISKGLLLSGPVGCGKTSILKLLRYLVPHYRSYEVIPCRNIVFGFNHIGYKTIEDYGGNGFICFDDMGVEPTGRFFGKDCNVIGEIMLSRYELYLEYGLKTHATTNLNAEELEDRYGTRVRSRMREMFNLIAFDTNSKDKRR